MDDDLQFCWDARKARSNLRKHGVSFEAATCVFDDPMQLETEDLFSQGEYRSIVIGRVDGELLTVVHASPEDGLIRIISARLSTAHERKAYEQSFFPAQARRILPILR
jgi:uncharacterized DUF497 family protein